jgi:hypothetical protein
VARFSHCVTMHGAADCSLAPTPAASTAVSRVAGTSKLA